MARLQVPGTAGSRVRLDLGRLLTRLGTTQLVALVPSRGMLHAVVVAGGRCTRHVVGPVMVAERELEFAIGERETGELALIDAALARIATGIYGECIDCAAPIPAPRLKASPEASRCVPCQEKVEQHQAA